MITGATRVAAVIGSPVAHSLSPALHNAAFADLGLDWVYVAFHVAEGGAASALDAMRSLGLAGLSVTMPHKQAVATLLAEQGRLEPAAAALASVNTVVPDADGTLVGHSTDGEGFVASLRAAGVEPTGRSVCLLGAGGAARAIADALGRSGVDRLVVRNRTPAAAVAVAALAAAGGAVTAVADPDDDAVVADADLVVNATSVGMGSGDDGPLPCRAEALSVHQVVADIVYHPRRTPLLRAAAAAGALTVDGLGMLVHQAALQQVLWHGIAPSVAVMTAAAERELAARHQ